MTLHEAIVLLLQQTGRSMTTTEIAHALTKPKHMQKRMVRLLLLFRYMAGQKTTLSFSSVEVLWYL